MVQMPFWPTQKRYRGKLQPAVDAWSVTVVPLPAIDAGLAEKLGALQIGGPTVYVVLNTASYALELPVLRTSTSSRQVPKLVELVLKLNWLFVEYSGAP